MEKQINQTASAEIQNNSTLGRLAAGLIGGARGAIVAPGTGTHRLRNLDTSGGSVSATEAMSNGSVGKPRGGGGAPPPTSTVSVSSDSDGGGSWEGSVGRAIPPVYVGLGEAGGTGDRAAEAKKAAAAAGANVSMKRNGTAVNDSGATTSETNSVDDTHIGEKLRDPLEDVVRELYSDRNKPEYIVRVNGKVRSGLVLIGSDERNDVYSPILANHQAALKIGPDGCTITSLDASEGVFVNGQRIATDEPFKIKESDKVELQWGGGHRTPLELTYGTITKTLFDGNALVTKVDNGTTTKSLTLQNGREFSVENLASGAITFKVGSDPVDKSAIFEATARYEHGVLKTGVVADKTANTGRTLVSGNKADITQEMIQAIRDNPEVQMLLPEMNRLDRIAHGALPSVDDIKLLAAKEKNPEKAQDLWTMSDLLADPKSRSQLERINRERFGRGGILSIGMLASSILSVYAQQNRTNQDLGSASLPDLQLQN